MCGLKLKRVKNMTENISSYEYQIDGGYEVESTVKFLNTAFSRAAYRRFKTNIAKRGDNLYAYQVEFAYLINEIVCGPPVLVPQLTKAIKALIEQVADGKDMTKNS